MLYYLRACVQQGAAAWLQVRRGWHLDEPVRAEVAWEAAYSDQAVEHAFTGILQRFGKPLGDTSHDIQSIWNGQARSLSLLQVRL